METSIDRNQQEKIESAQNLTKTAYFLQALGLLIGVSYVAAVFVNYLKFEGVKDTWLESHFIWQKRTFWFSLLWLICGLITLFFLIGFLIVAINYIWVIYRITKGWLRFNEGKPMYSEISLFKERLNTTTDGKWF